jgi:hypothetical protein
VNKRPSVEEREQITARVRVSLELMIPYLTSLVLWISARVRVSLELMIPYPASMILGIEVRVRARPECRELGV